MPIRDPEASHPVPEDWRPILAAIVGRFVDGDFRLVDLDRRVQTIDQPIADQLRANIEAYGATLVPLPLDVWDVAEAIWRDGDRWQVMVDLWTAEEGRSDLVLDAVVDDDGSSLSVAVHLVYVP